MASRSASGITAPRPSILSSSSDHFFRVMCCSVMRLALWQEVQAAFTLACIGPGGSGLPGALGACALAGIMDASRKIAGKTRWIKQDPFLSSQFSVLSSQFSVLSSQFSVLSSQFSVLSSQNWMCFVFCGCYFFALACEYRDVTPTSYFRGIIAVSDERVAMIYGAVKALAGTLSICLLFSGTFSYARCSVDVVIVNGRVEHAPRKGIVRVQLVYPKQKQQMGESGDVTVEGGSRWER